MTTPVNAHDVLVQRVIEARDRLHSVDPAEVAREIYGEMTPRQRAAVLRMVLPNAVREILNRPPAAGSDLGQGTKDLSTPRVRSSPGQPDPDRGAIAAPTPSVRALPGPSKMAIAGYFAQRMYSPEFGSTFLGDMTADMVRAVADYREKQSRDLADKVVDLRKLAICMDESRAEYVHDLPVDDVREILNGGV